MSWVAPPIQHATYSPYPTPLAALPNPIVLRNLVQNVQTDCNTSAKTAITAEKLDLRRNVPERLWPLDDLR